MIRKITKLVLLGALTVGILAGRKAVVLAEAEDSTFREMTGTEMVEEMGAGWNLGNTMDGHNNLTPSETAWQGVKTTQELIKSVHDMGFNTLRIPVTWGTMIDDENNYKIDQDWLKRIDEIAQYAMREGMYVIINIHHDGADGAYWLNTAADDMESVYRKFGAVWTHIAEYFREYDEHLIFEAMNEVYGGEEEIAHLNQTFVNAVRATGGNNAMRWLSIPGSGANIGSATSDFVFPKDTIADRLFFAVHYYEWAFGLQEDTEETKWTEEKSEWLYDQLKYLKKFFTKKGIPVILGEYGCIDKNNTSDRVYFNEVTTRMCKNMGVVPVYWDNGFHDEEKKVDYGFSLINRENGTAWYPEIIWGIMRGIYLEGTYQDVKKNPELISASSLEADVKELKLKAGETAEVSVDILPEDSNDVVLWKSEDEGVATVFRGKVHAVKDGTTNIIAFSQSGSVEKRIGLQVGNSQSIAKEQKEKNPASVSGELLVILLGSVCMVALGAIHIWKEKKK